MKLLPALILCAVSTPVLAAPRTLNLTPTVVSAPVPDDADDPAIWIHPTRKESSLILGTNKAALPTGGLYAFGLDGKVRQVIANLDRPNNVDVEYGLQMGAKKVDIAVVTERYQRRLRVFAIENGHLQDLAPAGLPVFEGQEGEAGAPMGVALYRRQSDGAIFAIVSRKTGPKRGYLWQYQLIGNAAGTVRAVKVREFGAFSGEGEIESVAVDDELGHVYYSDEAVGYHKWAADPASPDANTELALFGTEPFEGDREGIAILPLPGGRGYIVATEQIKAADGKSGSIYRFYNRSGSKHWPHDHSQIVATLHGGADDTDGIEGVTTPLGSQFPTGTLVAMNSKGHNFWFFSLLPVLRGTP